MSTSVAVVGGGVIGLSCARELARAGATVTVLEAGEAVGRGSSARANGGVRAQFTTPANVAFSRFSIDAFEELAREDDRIAFHQTGYLLIAGTPEREHALREAIDVQHQLGVPTEWLGPDDVVARAPFVRPEEIRGGAFHRRDGFLDPAGVVAASAADARRLGATIRTDAPVGAIGKGFVVGLDEGDVRADVVVNAAGADAKAIAELAGSDVPVEPVRRNLAHVMDRAGGWIVAYSDPDDPPGRETSVDPAFLPALASRLPNRFPFVLDLPIDPSRCWAGLYPETPDHHAILGEDPRVSGLFHCVGFGGHGVMHAPAAGRAVAELVMTGRSETFDVHPLRPSRFDEGDLLVETAVF